MFLLLESDKGRAFKATLKKIRGILNKLTPELFDELLTDLMLFDLEQNDEFTSRAIELFFDKAVEAPLYCELYARFISNYCKQRVRSLPLSARSRGGSLERDGVEGEGEEEREGEGVEQAPAARETVH